MSKFEKAVEAAVEAHHAFKAQEVHVQSGLTAKSYVREAELQAGLDGDDVGKRLETLATTLERPGHQDAAVALRDMVHAICGEAGQFKISRPMFRINHLVTDAARAQLAEGGFNPLELFALAARRAKSERPSAFGKVEDMPAAEQKLAELKAELESAIETVEASWGADDIEVGQDGRCVFRGLGVVLTSVDLGRRILDAAIAEARARAA